MISETDGRRSVLPAEVWLRHAGIAQCSECIVHISSEVRARLSPEEEKETHRHKVSVSAFGFFFWMLKAKNQSCVVFPRSWVYGALTALTLARSDGWCVG